MKDYQIISNLTISNLNLHEYKWEGESIITCKLPLNDDLLSAILFQLKNEKKNFLFSHQIGNRLENTYLSIDYVPEVRKVIRLGRDIVKEKWNISTVALYESLKSSHNNYPPFWFNISGFNQSTGIHDHAKPASVSGVFYLQCTSYCGDLFFRKEDKEDFEIVPEVGKMVLFPSRLKHGVYPNKTKKNRISLAFNLFPFPFPSEEW